MCDFLLVVHHLWKFISVPQGAQKKLVKDARLYTGQTGQVTLPLLSARTAQLLIAPSPALPLLPIKTSADPLKLVDVPALMSGETAYVMVDTASYYTRAVHSYDGVAGYLPYGKAVSVGRLSGRFAEVTAGDSTGWVLKDALTADQSAIYPTLEVGRYYSADTPETQLIRHLLNDAFAAEALLLPLQPEEYCTYRLRQIGITLPWGSERPRLAGTWHALLRGVPSVWCGIQPKTNALLEVVTNSQHGKLAWVEAVLPDQSVQLSAVGFDTEGEYTSWWVSESTWREWRPVWITYA